MITMTLPLARSAGLDAGNRSMRKAGRTAWNRTDQRAALRELTRLLKAAGLPA